MADLEAFCATAAMARQWSDGADDLGRMERRFDSGLSQRAGAASDGLDGGVVMLGQRTSKFGKKEFSDWLTFLHSVAIDRSVKF